MGHVETRTSSNPVRRLSVWSGPRNVSTALMYAFRQRRDAVVFDEPLYGHYLATSGAVHPGGDVVLAAMDTDGERVVREVLLGDAPPAGPGTLGFARNGVPGRQPPERNVRVYKSMAHHLRGLEHLDFLTGMEHLLLTREPGDMLRSLAAKIERPTVDDTGFPEQLALLSSLEARGITPIVIVAHHLLADPAGVLRRACDALGLPHDDGMTAWPAGEKPEDGVWAPYWYESVHRTTGFHPYVPHETPLPAELRPVLDACTPAYERMLAYAVTV
jgi:hypothetical protein